MRRSELPVQLEPSPVRTTRRVLLRATAALGAAAWPSCGTAMRSVETHIYKSVGNLRIRADVHRAQDGIPRPAAVWIHGGALINGGRQGVPRLLKDLLLEAGFAVVSIDYRLAPESKLPAIVRDVEDAFHWIRRDGAKLFQAELGPVVALGSSAGGYLALTSGHRTRVKPSAIVSFWGYGDLIGEWYSTPSPHTRHYRTVIPREEALRQVSGPPISNAADRNGNGGAFYQHCRQHGIWPEQVSGWDPREEAEKFEPYMPLCNVDPDFPPTFLVHGTSDTDVPYEQSSLMAEQFRRHGVPFELLSVEGAEHGLAGTDAGALPSAYKAAVTFLRTVVDG